LVRVRIVYFCSLRRRFGSVWYPANLWIWLIFGSVLIRCGFFPSLMKTGNAFKRAITRNYRIKHHIAPRKLPVARCVYDAPVSAESVPVTSCIASHVCQVRAAPLNVTARWFDIGHAAGACRFNPQPTHAGTCWYLSLNP